MTHFDAYFGIINFRKSNPLPEGQYGEQHHIVPRSVCPLLVKSKSNIVRLTAKEHFLAHYHLWKSFRDELHETKWAKSMCFALHMMKAQLLKCDNIEQLASLYEEARIEFAANDSGENNPMYGRRFKRSAETRRRLSESKTGIKNPMFGRKKSEETRKKLSKSLMGHVGYWTGKRQSVESVEKRAAKTRGKKRTAETRAKLSKFQKGLRWFTNGKVNSHSRTCPEGFWAGMTRTSKRKKQ